MQIKLNMLVKTCMAALLCLIFIEAKSSNTQAHFRDSIQFYLNEINSKETSDRQKYQVNLKLKKHIENNLPNYSFDDNTLDSIKYIGVLNSPDEKLRIITWNLVWQNGKNSYYGYVQTFKKGKPLKYFALNDKKDPSKDPFRQTLTKDNWFGALYYDIIPVECNKQTCYTILGYDPNDLYSNRKVVELLSFSKTGYPVFGMPVFQRGKALAHRVVFEYSEYAVMMLRYDDESERIVFDHLSPVSNQYAGNPKYYGPDFSYDGMKFKKGKWEYVFDIDLRNDK